MFAKSTVSCYRRSAFLNPLTSLRFFAALFIFFLHASNHSLFPPAIIRHFDFSKAVSFFFVLSGFILTYSYYNKTFSVINFYRLRLSRVWPITFISLLLVCIFLPASIYLPSQNSSVPIVLVFLVHTLCLQSLIPIPSFYFGYNAVAWSISTELCFYVIFPFLHRLQWSKLSLVWISSVFISLALSFVSLNFDIPGFGAVNYDQISWQGLVYISPLSRFNEFISGIIAARIFLLPKFASLFSSVHCSFCSLIPLPAFFLDLFVVLLLIYSTTISNFKFLPAPLGYSVSQIISGLIFSVFILYILHSSSTFTKILESNVLTFLGKISFSFYLFHQPIMIRSSQLGGLSIGGYQLMPSNLLIVFFWTLAVSIFSFACLERPLRSFLANAAIPRLL